MDRARRRIHSSGTVAELFPGYVADYEIPADVGIPLRCGRPHRPCRRRDPSRPGKIIALSSPLSLLRELLAAKAKTLREIIMTEQLSFIHHLRIDPPRRYKSFNSRPDIGEIDRKIRFHYYDIERDTLYEMIKEVIKYLEIAARV